MNNSGSEGRFDNKGCDKRIGDNLTFISQAI